MDLKQNDLIKIDGKEVKITSKHAAGKHVVFGLSDGRSLTDLHLRTDVEVVRPVLKSSMKHLDILPHAKFGEESHD